ncbi:MAG: glycoside hydrolase family 3 C-terminal domain-containing protein [Bacilli bacterium]|nr:glycoside hydrolase family 3 C-terminal domain-containing protein [Bacilli bacterium]
MGALKNTYRILFVATASLFGITAVGTKIAMENKGQINKFLHADTMKVIPPENASELDTEYYKSKFDNLDDVMNNGRDIARRVEEEGAVLLKNDNNALPLTEGNRKVTLFGVGSVDPVYSGTGSGSVDTSTAETFESAMNDKGLEVNPTVTDWYESTKKDNGRTYSMNWIIPNVYGEVSGLDPRGADWDDVKAANSSTFATYGDAAIFVISRVGGEGMDMPTGTSANSVKATNGDYLQLTDLEKKTLVGLKDQKDGNTFKRIIVLINSANPIDCSFLDNDAYGIDSALWIGSVGHAGLGGVANILTGAANPSGSLPDTYFIDPIANNPVMKNFGSYLFDNAGELLEPGRSFMSYASTVTYQEGIYVGYKYTETRYEDTVLARANVGTFSYNDVVKYPFGYGLSYSEFDYSDFSAKSNDDGTYTVSVTVTNNGTVAGKEPVQVYVQKPYTEYDVTNGIEKSAVDFIGFGKTGLIEPTKSETVTVTVDERDFASYDANKAKTYILDEGDYYLTVASDAHEAANNILAAKGKTTADGMTSEGDKDLAKSFHLAFDAETYSKDPNTGNPITNLFDEADPNKYENRGDNSVTWLSRNDWEGTYPTDYAHLKLNATMLAEMNQMAVPTDDVEYPTYDSGTLYKLIDLAFDDDGNDIAYDDPKWDKLLDQLTYAETVQLVSQGFRSTVQLNSIGKKLTVDSNGPVGLTDAYAAGANGLARKSGISADDKRTPTCYPCNPIVAATMNHELAKEMGDAMGEDALWAGYSGLYGPCSNVHRSSYGGRTFEYYSEDAILIGEIVTPVIEGLQDHGCYVYNKHFAFNDQETNRSGVCTWVNEQAARENYLEAFRRPIEKADSMCVMTSMNRLGVVCNYANDALCHDYLRTEIGMRGIAVTDYWSSAAAIVTLGSTIYSGEDLPDGNLDADAVASYIETYGPGKGYGKLAWNMRESAHRILYTVAHSNAMNGDVAGSTYVVLTPAWQITLRALEIGFGVALGATVVLSGLAIFGIFPKKKLD